MSRQLINQYYTKLERIIQYGGSRNETAIRQAFYALLNEYANKKNLELITEIRIKATKGNEVNPDRVNSTLMNNWHLISVVFMCEAQSAETVTSRRLKND